MHDQTAVRTEGIAEQLRLHPNVKAEVDEDYRGLADEFPDQVSAPPKKPKGDAPPGDRYARREQRRRQSSARSCVEHANAEHKQWRPLQRFLGHRENHPATHRAIAGRVSDRAAQRATRGKPSTELVPVHTTACSITPQPTLQTSTPRPHSLTTSLGLAENQGVASRDSARWCGMCISDEVRGQLAVKFEVLFPHLDERQRRLLMGAEARILGHGGIRAVAQAAEASESTVR
ncbi:hypothetical protein ACFV57_21525, partial [Streptomyces sp. NPDC059788]